MGVPILKRLSINNMKSSKIPLLLSSYYSKVKENASKIISILSFVAQLKKSEE